MIADQNSTPGSALTWRAIPTAPDCDERVILVAWGVWPYKIVAYDDTAIIERFGHSGPSLTTIVREAGERWGYFLARLQIHAEATDAKARADLVDMLAR